MRSLGLTCFLLLVSGSILGQSRCPDRSTPRDRPLEIVDKPRASYPEGLVDAQGTVTLRVEFLSNSKIGRINVIKGLPHGLTEQAIQAARHIKFKPEIKRCKSVDTFRPVSYAFQRY